MLKGYVVCFKLCLFQDYDSIFFPWKILHSQFSLIITIYISFLEFFWGIFLSLLVMYLFDIIFLPNCLVQVNPTISTP